jgi:hypothetical protein
VSLRLAEQKESLGRADKTRGVSCCSAAIVCVVAQTALTVIIGGSVCRCGEVEGAKNESQHGESGECDCLHEILSSMSAPVADGFLVRQPLRASADGMGEWEADGSLALKPFTPRAGRGQSRPARLNPEDMELYAGGVAMVLPDAVSPSLTAH